MFTMKLLPCVRFQPKCMAGFLPCVVWVWWFVAARKCREVCAGKFCSLARCYCREEYNTQYSSYQYGDCYVKETKSEGKTAIKTNIITLALMVIKTIYSYFRFAYSTLLLSFTKEKKGLLVYTTVLATLSCNTNRTDWTVVEFKKKSERNQPASLV